MYVLTAAGEELNVGTSQNNYLAFEVRVMSSGMGGNSSQGSLVTYWPGVPNQGASGCSATVTWPVLANVTILGVSAVNTASVAVQVWRPPLVLMLLNQTCDAPTSSCVKRILC